MVTQWNRQDGLVICYAVTTHHQVFKLPTALGPFPTAAEAGSAIDRLLARYPGASMRLERMPASDLADADLEEKLQDTLVLLDTVLSEPFSVVEPIEHSREEVTADQVEQVATRIGCPSSDVVVFQAIAAKEGEPIWVIFRRHLHTSEAAKAETKALWLRRERLQQGGHASAITVLSFPLYCPAGLD